jgi:membrane protease YdiL (CAAX protease family)
MDQIKKQSKVSAINWHQVGTFLGLIFLITILIDLVLWQWAGFGASASTLLLLQLQMLIPAFTAILLGVFFFKDSPVYFRTYRERPRWFFYLYLLFTLAYIALAVLSILMPEQAITISTVSGALNILVLMLLVAIRALSGREAFTKAGLRGGRVLDWPLWGAAFVLFYGLQAALNALFGLGERVDVLDVMGSLGVQTGSMAPEVFMLVMTLQTIVVGAFLGIVMGFGEEYGWRGYLQGQLIKLGKKRGVLLVGLIWGAWHYPVIWMGHNYPGQPLWGTLLMTIYTVLLGFVLGHVMLKTGSVWLVAFLHALNNQTISFFTIMVYRASDPVLSFNTGVYGLLTMIPVVYLLLRDPVWKDDHITPSSDITVEIS